MHDAVVMQKRDALTQLSHHSPLLLSGRALAPLTDELVEGALTELHAQQHSTSSHLSIEYVVRLLVMVVVVVVVVAVSSL